MEVPPSLIILALSGFWSKVLEMCNKAQGQGSYVGDKFCESIHCKYIRKQENIRLEIEVVKISNSFTLKCTPYVECVLIIIVTNIFVIQFWIKLWFWRKLSFREASDWWSIVVRINSFLCEKWKIIFNYCLCVFEIWGLKIWNKIGKRCLKKLKRVNKSNFKIKWDYFSIFARFIFVDFYLLGKRNIFLPSWWNARQSTFESGTRNDGDSSSNAEVSFNDVNGILFVSTLKRFVKF